VVYLGWTPYEEDNMREEVTGALYWSKGRLRYGKDNNGIPKLTLEIDSGIVDLYLALIPKWVGTPARQKYPPHISVVRKEPDLPNPEKWGLHEGKEIAFAYSPVVRKGTVYWWLNAFSKELEEVRLELGLPVSSPYTRPPEGYDKCFHITIGNSKSS
jgi:hypothetical protein